jgi:UDP-N-acetylglucosamine:LPS N-acetylglucosamine transferase
MVALEEILEYIMVQKRRLVAIASGGGHWIQLLRLRLAFNGYDTFYISTQKELCHDVPGKPYYSIMDANRDKKAALLILLLQLTWVLLSIRPNFIVTTGAAPGYFALALGKLMGARTVWLDSIANANELSLSGKKARRFADAWLTQWEHLSEESGPEYWGSVL